MCGVSGKGRQAAQVVERFFDSFCSAENTHDHRGTVTFLGVERGRFHSADGRCDCAAIRITF
jgi:hypothetical protein